MRVCASEETPEGGNGGTAGTVRFWMNLVRQDGPDYAVATLHLGSFLNIEKRPRMLCPIYKALWQCFAGFWCGSPAMEGAAEITLASVYSRMGEP